MRSITVAFAATAILTAVETAATITDSVVPVSSNTFISVKNKTKKQMHF